MKKRSVNRVTAFAAAAALMTAGTTTSFAENDEFYYDDDFFYEETTPNYVPPENGDKVDDLINNIYFGDWTDYDPEDDNSADEELPSKFDLRDVDGVCYVPEIRSQSPFGTCWSFGAVAAAEISLAYQLGIDFNTASDFEKAALDLSEKHLSWFSYTPLPEKSPFYSSQSGEGYHYKAYDEGIDSDEETHILYDFGGHAHYAAVLFSEGAGPALEAEVPYINNAGTWNVTIYTITVTDDDWQESDYRYEKLAPDSESVKAYLAEYANEHPGIQDYDTEYHGQNGVYYKMTLERTTDGDWSVDESKRFQGIFLKHSNILPAPASMGRASSEYEYNEKATEAIKKELLAGKGVAVTMFSDHSMPGYVDESDNVYLSFHTSAGSVAEYMDEADIWSHYTYCADYDPSDPYTGNYCHYANHVVCVVGYDDDFPKEYFRDPHGTIGGNGAWIARNSWGSKENSDPTAVYDWGNGGDGYFYISYYDQSLDTAESYDFELFANEDEGRSLELYDLFPQFNYQTALSDEPIYMANVFTADNDETIRDVGIMTALPGLTAKVSVYILNDGFKSPVDGKKVAGTEETFEYMGYHTMKLDDETAVSAGQKYSVVLELVRGDGKYVFEINRTENKASHDEYESYRKEMYIEEYGSLDGYEDESPLYGVMIVNEGESWLGAGDDASADWRDLTKVIDSFRLIDSDIIGGAFNDYDNFPIRSYPYTSLLEVHNSVNNEKSVYEAGDEIEGIVTISNYSALESYDNIKLNCSLLDLGEDGEIPVLESGDEITLTYGYFVTDEDLGKGTLTSDITVFIDGEQIYLNEKFSDLSFTVNVADKKPEITEPVATPDSSTGTAGTADAPKTDKGGFPVLLFVVIGVIVLVAAGVLITIVVIRKRKRKI